MARRPSDEQVIIQEKLATGDLRSVVDFLRQNPKQMGALTKLTPDEFPQLPDALMSRNKDIVGRARDFLDSSLEDPSSIQYRDLKLTRLVRGALAKHETSLGWKNLKKGRPVRALANLWAGTMTGVFGLNTRQRNTVAIGLAAPIAISVGMNAVFNDATQASLPGKDIHMDPHRLAQEETLTMETLLSEQYQGAAAPSATLNYAPDTDINFSNPALQSLNKLFSPLSRNFNPLTVEGLQIQVNGTIKYRDWTVPRPVYEANARTSHLTGFPADLLYAIHAAESSFIPDNVNEDSNACGLGQFVPTTFYEKIYNYGALIGYPETKALVDRYVASRDDQDRAIFGFRPASEDAEKTLATLCHDPHLNSMLTAVYGTRTIGTMQRNLQDLAPAGAEYFPLNQGQYYVAYHGGRYTAERMIRNLYEDGGTRDAHMFFNKNATDQNLPVLFVDGDRSKPRSVAEFFDYMTDYKGLGDEILPDMRDWGERRQAIATALASKTTVRTASQPHKTQANAL